jgi:hypothetical protein
VIGQGTPHGVQDGGLVRFLSREAKFAATAAFTASGLAYAFRCASSARIACLRLRDGAAITSRTAQQVWVSS